jgi:hypothetical protein
VAIARRKGKGASWDEKPERQDNIIQLTIPSNHRLRSLPLHYFAKSLRISVASFGLVYDRSTRFSRFFNRSSTTSNSALVTAGEEAGAVNVGEGPLEREGLEVRASFLEEGAPEESSASERLREAADLVTVDGGTPWAAGGSPPVHCRMPIWH